MKKEWKKVLSLVLALAMVLSICPFAFAEGEEVEEVTPVQTTYDFAEYFETTNTWTGDAEKDYAYGYDEEGRLFGTSLTFKGGSQWNTASWWANGADILYDKKKVVRIGEASRAYSDNKNTTLTLKEGKTNSTERIPNMVAGYQVPTGDILDQAKGYYHWDGTAGIVMGDSGFAATTAWPYGGCLGYGFSTGKGYFNSGLGTASASGTHQLVEFTVPRSGIINPEIRIFSNNWENLAYRMYVVKAGEAWKDKNWTNIYPAAGTGTTIVGGAFPLTEAEASGWIALPSGADEQRSSATLWVEEGDKIYLHFATTDGVRYTRGFTLDTVKIHYLTEKDMAYYPDTRTIDLRVDNAPEGTTYTAQSDSLVETDVAGVFTVDDTYVDGTPVAVVIDSGVATATLTVTLTGATYDIAEAFYTTDTYADGATGIEKYPAFSQTPKYANDGTGRWTIGYYEYGNLTKLYLYDYLQRKPSHRAIEDTTATTNTAGTFDQSAERRAARIPNMVWIDTTTYIYKEGNEGSLYANIDQDGGYSISVINAPQGSFGYTFGMNETYLETGTAGQISYAGNTVHPTAIFVAPIDGVINPVMQAVANNSNTIAYRMYKEDASTGALTQIYPAATATNLIQLSTDWNGVYPVSDIVNNNWAYLPAQGAGYLLEDKGAVRVNAGDKIYLRFAGTNGSESYSLKQLTMNYLGRFGEDDELLLQAPFTAYEEETVNLVTPRDKVVDLSRELLNPEAKGTMEYTITGNTEVLRETAIGGVYELTGKTNAGGEAAVVTAGYYSKGKSSANGDKPLYTTSTEVYVNAASMAVDTFSYDLFKTTQLGYEDDGFLLPYYTNATERAMYGEIDLGLHADWAKAEVTISDETKVKYLGNGRIRVVGKHDFKDAGGTFPSHGSSQKPTTTAPSYNGHPAVRDITTAGANPIVMTITAPDGGARKFNIWTFNAKVHGDTASETYGFDYANYYVPNAVTRFEGFIDMTATNGGSFVPMYRDSGRNTNISPVSDDMYLQAETTSYWFPKVPTFSTVGELIMFSYNKNNWEGYTNTEYVDFDGASWTFEAPKTGVVNVENFMTDKLHTNNNYHFLSNAVVYVRKYALDGTYTELIKRTYGSNYGSNSTGGIFSDAVDTTGTMAESLNDDGTMDVAVKKGEIIRVILANNTDTTAVSTLVKKNSKNADDTALYLPTPTFTYQYADGADEFDGGGVYVTPSTFEGISAENVFTLFFDQNGQLIGNSKAADEGSSEDEYFGIYLPDTGDTAFAKVFFWDSLTNIQPLTGDIMVRK